MKTSCSVKYSIIFPSETTNLLLFFTVFLWIPAVWCHINGRVQYHEQGYKGIDSYRYGFEVPDLYNPQTRHEERDENGVVVGRYSYLEPSGKIREIHYAAHPAQGFKITKNLSIEPPTTPPPPPPPPPPPSRAPLFEPQRIVPLEADYDFDIPFEKFGLRPRKKQVLLGSSSASEDSEEEEDTGIGETSQNFMDKGRLVKIAFDGHPIYNRVRIVATPKPQTSKKSRRRKSKKKKRKKRKKKRKRRKKVKKGKMAWPELSSSEVHVRPFRTKKKASSRYVKLRLPSRPKKSKKRRPKKKRTRKRSKSKALKKLPRNFLLDDFPLDFSMDEGPSNLVIRKMIIPKKK